MFGTDILQQYIADVSSEVTFYSYSCVKFRSNAENNFSGNAEYLIFIIRNGYKELFELQWDER